jgi:hypothetical protein
MSIDQHYFVHRYFINIYAYYNMEEIKKIRFKPETEIRSKLRVR